MKNEEELKNRASTFFFFSLNMRNRGKKVCNNNPKETFVSSHSKGPSFYKLLNNDIMRNASFRPQFFFLHLSLSLLLSKIFCLFSSWLPTQLVSLHLKRFNFFFFCTSCCRSARMAMAFYLNFLKTYDVWRNSKQHRFGWIEKREINNEGNVKSRASTVKSFVLLPLDPIIKALEVVICSHINPIIPIRRTKWKEGIGVWERKKQENARISMK